MEDQRWKEFRGELPVKKGAPEPCSEPVNMTEDMARDLRAFSVLARDILCGGAYKVTKYLSDKRTIKATRKMYRGGWRKGENIDIVFTLGKPNYEEREKIKRAKKAGETLDTVSKFPTKK
jgi:hypothetical protein